MPTNGLEVRRATATGRYERAVPTALVLGSEQVATQPLYPRAYYSGDRHLAVREPE
jgi:hypothetical protein